MPFKQAVSNHSRPLLVKVPGSKSLTNRALALAALAQGVSRLTNSVKSDDTNFMANGLRQLGVRIQEPRKSEFLVEGRGGQFQKPARALFLGNAGTAVRFLTGLSALASFPITIRGNSQMQRRPLKDLTTALATLGCRIKFLRQAGYPPLTIRGCKLAAKRVAISGAVSSQFISALAFILPFCAKEIQLVVKGNFVSQQYFALTLALQRNFGVCARQIGPQTWGYKSQAYRAAKIAIEPDASSATYFWAAEALTGRKILIEDLPTKSLQPDFASRQLFQIFPRSCGEVSAQNFPDAIPTLAVVAAYARGPTRFIQLKNLRVKECDRVAALVENLNLLKPGLARATKTTLTVFGDPQLRPARPVRIRTQADHRIAMSFALVNLRGGKTLIDQPDCVRKSFPNFWPEFQKIFGR